MVENEPIIVEQTYDAPIDRVWKTLTDKDQMRQWFFESMDTFKPEAGFETQFNVQANGRNNLHIWKVTEAVPGKRLALNWRYGGYAGDSTVTIELFPQGLSTRVRLTHSGQETFPRDNPDFSRESCTKGWDYFIGKRLRAFLENSNTSLAPPGG